MRDVIVPLVAAGIAGALFGSLSLLPGRAGTVGDADQWHPPPSVPDQGARVSVFTDSILTSGHFGSVAPVSVAVPEVETKGTGAFPEIIATAVIDGERRLVVLTNDGRVQSYPEGATLESGWQILLIGENEVTARFEDGNTEILPIFAGTK